MSWQFPPYLYIILVSLVMTASLSYLTWKRGLAQGARPFAWSMIMLSLWSAMYALETCSAGLAAKLVFSGLGYIGIVSLPVAWLAFSLEYTSFQCLRRTWLLAALCLIPVTSLALLATNALHHWFWIAARLVDNGGYTVLVYDYGPAFVVHGVYSYAALLVATALIVRRLSDTVRPLQAQVIILAIAIIFSTSINLAYLLGVISLNGVDPTSMSFAVTGLLIYWTIYRHRLFQVAPLAWSNITGVLTDGMFILDPDDEVIEINKAAAEALGQEAAQIIHKKASEAFASWPQLHKIYQEGLLSSQEISLGEGESERWYELHVTSLPDSQARPAGRMLSFNEITGLKQVEGSLRASERRQAQLNEITRAALESNRTVDGLQLLAEQLHKALAADGCYLVLWDDEHQLQVPAAAAGPMSQEFLNFEPVRNRDTLAGAVITSKKTIAVTDFTATPYAGLVGEGPLHARPILGLPLLASERVMGAALVAFQKGRSITEDEIQIGEQAAGQVSLAIARLQALELAQAHTRQAEHLRQSLEELVSALDLRQMLDNLLVHLEQVVPYDSAAVFLQEGNTLRVEAERGFPVPGQVLGKNFPADDVLLKEAREKKTVVILQDAQADERFHRWGGNDYTRGWMGVPLLVREVPIGALTLDSRQVSAFGPKEAGMVKMFADQAAIAIEKARLYAEVKERATKLAALNTATAALLGTLDLTELLGEILSAAIHAIPEAEKGALGLIDPLTGNLEIRYTEGYSDPRVNQAVFQDGEGYAMRSVYLQKPLIIHDTGSDPAFEYTGELSEVKEIRSALVAPLILDDRVIGVISLDSTRPNAFPELDLQLLVTFAATATAAIRNAKLHAEVQQQAITDALTGLYNLRGLYELGWREVERARRFHRPLTVILFDIDHFKRVNDTHGHEVGNQVLTGLAAVCRTNVREIDITARYGGDEFVILLPETAQQPAWEIAERLRSMVSNTPFQTKAGRQWITISLGATTVCDKVPDLADIIKTADEAMYEAKNAGRNRIRVKESAGTTL